MEINPSIFREYDVRGVAGSSFSPEAIAEYEKWYGPFPGITITLDAAAAIGKAYGTFIRRAGGRRVVVGHEIRPFADELTNAFISGVRAVGVDIDDLGVSLTPVVYFNTATAGVDGGVNVTGSHNVYFYNGFKMMGKDVAPIFGQALQEMRQMILAESFESVLTSGNYTKRDGYASYRDYVLKHIELVRKPKVVIDCGNGSAGLFAPEIFRALGCEVIELFSEPDASFPNHMPDPEQPQYLTALVERVVSEKADLGIAFDADGDRVGFVTEKGDFVDADLTLLVYAKDVLARFPGKKILFDVKCSALLEELIPQFGGVPLMHRTGHAPIKDTLRRDADIIFAGEVSGHFFFVEDYFRIDDGLYAAARLLEIFLRSNSPFSELFVEFPKRVRTPELKLPCADEAKFKIVAKIQQDLVPHYSTVLIDGVRFRIGEHSWGLIRASNTSPYLTVRAEAETEPELLHIKNIIADELEKFPEITDHLNRTEVATLTGRLGWV